MPRLRTRIVPRGGSALPALTAPTPPTQGPPEPVGTTSVSLTWTHPTAPASGITYALTATDTATGDPVTPSSGSGLGPWVLPTSDGQGIICTLTVTRTADSQAVPSLPYYVAIEQDVADAYPLESTAGWRTVKEWNLKGQGSQTIVNGAGTITLDSDTITTRGAASTGTFGTNNTCTLSAADGFKFALTSTAGQLPEVTLTLPLGETISNDNAIRVSFVAKIYNGDSNDSVIFSLCEPGATPVWDGPSTATQGGFRVLGQTATLTCRRGGSASAGVTVPAGWSNGTTLYVELTVPGHANDVLVKVDDSGFLNATPDFFGRSQSAPASPTTNVATFQGSGSGISALKLMIAVANGGSGAGLPRVELPGSIKIEVR